MTATQLWGLALPQLFGEVELDLAQHHLIADLDRALDTRTWHFVRSAIERLLAIEGTWLGKAARDGLRKDRLSDLDAGRSGLQEGRRRS
ncbi:hypothetical protein [Subtercola boreus]|uniref:hypothetical protein n=1 Tax=Subtercola boreus TaxID=120213 RepID=UPI0011C01CAF|nr:hypothetical protein [Subtercola boreus]